MFRLEVRTHMQDLAAEYARSSNSTAFYLSTN